MIHKSEFGVADVPAFDPVTYRKHQHKRVGRDGKTLTYEYNIPIIICPDCSRYTIVRCGRSDGGRFGVVSNHKGLTGRLCSFSGTEVKIGKSVDANYDIDNPDVCLHLKQVGDRAVRRYNGKSRNKAAPCRMVPVVVCPKCGYRVHVGSRGLMAPHAGGPAGSPQCSMSGRFVVVDSSEYFKKG